MNIARMEKFEALWSARHDLPAESLAQYRFESREGYRLPELAAHYRTFVDVLSLKEDEQLCPACKGSGEGWVLSDGGPDAHHIQVDCPECFGPGTMRSAYEAMKIQRDSHIERTNKAGGELFFMRIENESLRKDAERYRWLRLHEFDIGSYHPTNEHNAEAWFESISDESIDQCIADEADFAKESGQ